MVTTQLYETRNTKEEFSRGIKPKEESATILTMVHENVFNHMGKLFTI